MKKSLLTTAALALGLSFSTVSNAQLADGSIAPNFTSTDINGNSWDLYTILAQGKTVVIDISATWCGPCWNYHNTGALDQLMAAHGPAGMSGVNASTTDDMMVFFIEGDGTTNTACLTSATGCNSTTQGNWVTGSLPPIIDDATIANSYQIGYFPSIFMICPDKVVRLAGQLSASALYSMKQSTCATATAANDASLLNTFGNSGLMACDSVNPTLKLTNESTTPLTSATITYKVDGITQKVTNWTGNLASYAMASVTGVKLGAAPGTHTITATVSSPNGGADAVASNNSNTPFTFNIFSPTGGPAVVENFQASVPPPSWLIVNGGQADTWASASVGGFMASSQSTTLRFYDIPAGDVDGMILDPQSFSGAASVSMTFDVAYKRYSTSTTYADQLRVKVSTNCGASWSTVYSKAGATLATVTAVTTSDYSPTTAAEWRTETVNLNAYAGQANVLVQFEGTSKYGNNLYIDNINVATSVTGISEVNNISYANLYPNPTSSQATLELSLASSESVMINVYNNLGEIVYSEAKNNLPAGDNKITLATEGLANGMYNVSVSSKQGFVTKKLTVSK